MKHVICRRLSLRRYTSILSNSRDTTFRRLSVFPVHRQGTVDSSDYDAADIPRVPLSRSRVSRFESPTEGIKRCGNVVKL